MEVHVDVPGHYVFALVYDRTNHFELKVVRKDTMEVALSREQPRSSRSSASFAIYNIDTPCFLFCEIASKSGMGGFSLFQKQFDPQTVRRTHGEQTGNGWVVPVIVTAGDIRFGALACERPGDGMSGRFIEVPSEICSEVRKVLELELGTNRFYFLDSESIEDFEQLACGATVSRSAHAGNGGRLTIIIQPTG